MKKRQKRRKNFPDTGVCNKDEREAERIPSSMSRCVFCSLTLTASNANLTHNRLRLIGVREPGEAEEAYGERRNSQNPDIIRMIDRGTTKTKACERLSVRVELLMFVSVAIKLQGQG